MRKQERDLRKMVTDLGLSIDEFSQTNGGHYKLRLRHADGRTMLCFAAETPSDGRGLLNLRGDIRRHFGLENARGKVDRESRPVV